MRSQVRLSTRCIFHHKVEYSSALKMKINTFDLIKPTGFQVTRATEKLQDIHKTSINRPLQVNTKVSVLSSLRIDIKRETYFCVVTSKHFESYWSNIFSNKVEPFIVHSNLTHVNIICWNILITSSNSCVLITRKKKRWVKKIAREG